MENSKLAVEMLEIRQSLSDLDDKGADAVAKIGDCVTKSELSNILLEITFFSDNTGKALHKVEFDDFRAEYPSLKIYLKTTDGKIHDRFIVVDYDTKTEKIYHCGASSKDGGRKVSTITLLSDNALYSPLFAQIIGNQELVLG